MREAAAQFLFFGVSVSVGGYLFGCFLKRKWKFAIINPLLISIVCGIVLLAVTGIRYEDYMESAKYLSYLLTPVTVCLAIPLYRQLQMLRQHFKAIMAGIAAGVVMSLLSVALIAGLFGLDQVMTVTLLPKSITTAIGMGLSEELGGVATITVAAIIITGIFGNIAGLWICKLFRITEPVAIGVAMGTASHAIGTAKAMELGEIEGAMSSLAISVAGICTVPAVLLFVQIVYKSST